jgi:hypothetical protein
VKATRSVPKEKRDALTTLWKWTTIEGPKWDAKIEALAKKKLEAKLACGFEAAQELMENAPEI